MQLLFDLLCFLTTGNPVSLIMEYCPYGCLHTYLHIKRRARLSNNTQTWAGLNFLPEDSQSIKALEETDRVCLSTLLDNYEIRSRAFNIPLCQSFSEVDVLLFGLQLASVMGFLCEQGVSSSYQYSNSNQLFIIALDCL